VSDNVTVAPIYAAPKQLGPLFNISIGTLRRIERGDHQRYAGFPKPKIFGGRKLYPVEAIKAFIDALPEGEKSPRGRRPKMKHAA
jgi:hypothetical protein